MLAQWRCLSLFLVDFAFFWSCSTLAGNWLLSMVVTTESVSCLSMFALNRFLLGLFFCQGPKWFLEEWYTHWVLQSAFVMLELPGGCRILGNKIERPFVWDLFAVQGILHHVKVAMFSSPHEGNTCFWLRSSVLPTPGTPASAQKPHKETSSIVDGDNTTDIFEY